MNKGELSIQSFPKILYQVAFEKVLKRMQALTYSMQIGINYLGNIDVTSKKGDTNEVRR
jgi:hypothetical protein